MDKQEDFHRAYRCLNTADGEAMLKMLAVLWDGVVLDGAEHTTFYKLGLHDAYRELAKLKSGELIRE